MLAAEKKADDEAVLGAIVDIFRLRQYFDVATRARELAGDLAADLGFLNVARKALLPLPLDLWPEPREPFGPPEHERLERLADSRVALIATGGSGALASVAGAGRALEECGITPAAISVCSGSAMFGFPLGAGVPADEVADFTLSLRPEDYVDIDWPEFMRSGRDLSRSALEAAERRARRAPAQVAPGERDDRPEKAGV